MATKEQAIFAKLKYLSIIGPDPSVYGIIGLAISGDKSNWHVRILYNHPNVKQYLPEELEGVKFASTLVSTLGPS